MHPAPPACPPSARASPTRAARALRSLSIVAALLACTACTPSRLVADRLGDTLASGGTVFAADDDPELIRAATPFSLKLIDGVLEERPDHRGLLAAATRAYTQYAYAFLQMDADLLEDDRLDAALALRARARGLYRRARAYGLRGLDTTVADFRSALQAAPQATLAKLGRADLPLLHWTAAAWAAEIALSTDDAEVLADLPLVVAMVERVLALDEAFEDAAAHSLMIALAMSRSEPAELREARAREHFRRAEALTGGALAGPYLALAESVALASGARAEFEQLLQRALVIDPQRRPGARLANILMQRRARWLLGRTDQLFLE